MHTEKSGNCRIHGFNKLAKPILTPYKLVPVVFTDWISPNEIFKFPGNFRAYYSRNNLRLTCTALTPKVRVSSREQKSRLACACGGHRVSSLFQYHLQSHSDARMII